MTLGTTDRQIKSGINIFGLAFIFEKVSSSLINIFAIKRLSVEEFGAYSDLGIWLSFFILVIINGTGGLFVNYQKERSAAQFIQIRLLLLIASIPVAIIVSTMQSVPLLFLLFGCLDAIVCFPQYFQVRFENVRQYYYSVIAKSVVLAVGLFLLIKNDSINLESLLGLWILAYGTSTGLIVFPRLNTLKFLLQVFPDYSRILRDGFRILGSQFIFFLRLSAPIYIITHFFPDYLKEFRLFLIPANLLQQLVFVITSALYPSIQSERLEPKDLSKPLGMGLGAMLCGLFLAQFFETDLWNVLFSDVPVTDAHKATMWAVGIAAILNVYTLTLISIKNARGEFRSVLRAHSCGLGASLLAAIAGVVCHNYLLVAFSPLIFDIVCTTLLLSNGPKSLTPVPAKIP